jgi:L,D-transpeptidase ErfK/SrfK
MTSTGLSRRSFFLGIGATGAAIAFPAVANTSSVAQKSRTAPDVIGEIHYHVARKEDTLLDLARANNLGFVEMAAANRGVDPWIPPPGTKLVLPTMHVLPDGPREGLLLNMADMRLYYFPRGGGRIESFAIGVGQDGWKTPTGATSVVRKKKDPTWFPPKSIRKEDPTLPAVVPPGPANPLGRYAMYLGWRSYLIHSTNKPLGVGRRVSHGCIRMYPEGIADLFPRLPVGTPVTVVSQPAKIGWNAGALYLEIHPSARQADEIEETGKFTHEPVPELAHRLVAAAGQQVDSIDWKAVYRAVEARTGMPVAVLETNRAASTDR